MGNNRQDTGDMSIDRSPLDLRKAPSIDAPAQNPADTSSSSPSASPTPTNGSPIRDSSARLSAIQTVQSYFNHEAEAIRSHLTAVLPGLIRGEVRTQCTQLSQEIGAQIGSIPLEIRMTRCCLLVRRVRTKTADDVASGP